MRMFGFYIKKTSKVLFSQTVRLAASLVRRTLSNLFILFKFIFRDIKNLDLKKTKLQNLQCSWK